MGIYLNPGARRFIKAVRSPIYVDKTDMIGCVNQVIDTDQGYVCVSRPRRFGKSMAANMLSAYYDRTVDADAVFRGLNISSHADFDAHRNKYDVLFINIQEFLSESANMDEMLALLKQSVLWDILQEYPDYNYFDKTNLSRTLADVFYITKRPFVIIIDEWDCIFREYKDNQGAQRQYLDFLRDWLKDKAYIGLAYMTGILPIKKYGTHSALNIFTEFSMMDAGMLAAYVGFTEREVRMLCEKYKMNFEETKNWYDGYYFNEVGSIYNPRSVVQSMLFQKFNNYWNQTETFEALKIYIDMNFEGLKDSIILLMAGGRKVIDTRSFTNDMTTFHSADDVMTLLIHLGYLGYDFDRHEAFIPNKEIMDEFVTTTTVSQWSEIICSIKQSDALLQATWKKDSDAVALGVEAAHLDTAHLQYNDENALSYTVSLAYYSARQYYTIIREMPTGQGFADMVFIPRKKYADKPAMIVELKWNKDVRTAINQIKERQYGRELEAYNGSILLVGINYDKASRKHTCHIEEWIK